MELNESTQLHKLPATMTLGELADLLQKLCVNGSRSPPGPSPDYLSTPDAPNFSPVSVVSTNAYQSEVATVSTMIIPKPKSPIGVEMETRYIFRLYLLIQKLFADEAQMERVAILAYRDILNKYDSDFGETIVAQPFYTSPAFLRDYKSRERSEFKRMNEAAILSHYGLRSSSTEVVKARVNQLIQSYAFIYTDPNLINPMEMYLNPIFPILVVSTFYVCKAGSFRGIGRHYPDMLNPPPLKFLAFVVMMVHHILGQYQRSGKRKVHRPGPNMQELYKTHKRRLRTFMTRSPTAFNLCIQRFGAMVDEGIKHQCQGNPNTTGPSGGAAPYSRLATIDLAFDGEDSEPDLEETDNAISDPRGLTDHGDVNMPSTNCVMEVQMDVCSDINLAVI